MLKSKPKQKQRKPKTPPQTSNTDPQKVWFHGTRSIQELTSIKKNGFRKGTYFARHMEDAVGYGGPYVAWVKVRFDHTPLEWQAISANKIPARSIIGWCYVRGQRKIRKRMNEIFGSE